MTTTSSVLPTIPTNSRVVVGVDGSEPSLRALHWAAFLARSLQVGIEAVTCWSWGSVGYAPYPTDWNPAVDARTTLDQALAAAFDPAHLPADLKVTVEEGSAPKILLDLSAGAAVLVVGSRGHGGFAGLLLGSVSGACSEHSVCPVLVVHGTTPAPPPDPA